MTYKYRICRKCGFQVNVSSQLRQEKKYICPRCAGEPWYMTREWMVRREQTGPAKK